MQIVVQRLVVITVLCLASVACMHADTMATGVESRPLMSTDVLGKQAIEQSLLSAQPCGVSTMDKLRGLWGACKQKTASALHYTGMALQFGYLGVKGVLAAPYWFDIGCYSVVLNSALKPLLPFILATLPLVTKDLSYLSPFSHIGPSSLWGMPVATMTKAYLGLKLAEQLISLLRELVTYCKQYPNGLKKAVTAFVAYIKQNPALVTLWVMFAAVEGIGIKQCLAS